MIKRLQTTATEIYDIFQIEDYLQKGFSELENETFEDIRRCHDWRNYIYDKDEWGDYRHIRRLLLYCQAVIKAEDEEWD